MERDLLYALNTVFSDLGSILWIQLPSHFQNPIHRSVDVGYRRWLVVPIRFPS